MRELLLLEAVVGHGVGVRSLPVIALLRHARTHPAAPREETHCVPGLTRNKACCLHSLNSTCDVSSSSDRQTELEHERVLPLLDMRRSAAAAS